MQDMRFETKNYVESTPISAKLGEINAEKPSIN